MYILYSNNLKTGEVLSRGPQYVHRDEAISNLIKEVQNYLFIYKRIENHKIVREMNLDHVDPEIVWYIVRPDDKEHEITLYRVTQEITKGWLGETKEYKLEKHMIFSVMDLPHRPIHVDKREPVHLPETPRVMKPSICNNEMFSELLQAIAHRREVTELE